MLLRTSRRATMVLALAGVSPMRQSPHGFHTGYCKSGLGGEDGHHGVEGYLRKKTMYNNYP